MTATFVVETGSGSATANSLLSVDDATQYNENHNDDSVWNAADPSDQEKALRLATQYVVSNYSGRWRGCLKYSTQALPWPREGVEVDGQCRVSTVVPPEVKDAVAELAIRSINGEELIPDISAGSGSTVGQRIKIGPLEFEDKFASSSSQYAYYTVSDRILSPLLISGSELRRG